MYSLCFLDRTNIRNARLDHLEQYMNLQRGRGVQYAGTVLAAIGGIYPQIPLGLAWKDGNVRGGLKQGTGYCDAGHGRKLWRGYCELCLF
jgi:hypothetical protein